MLRVAAFALALIIAAPAFADPLTLRARVEANGPAITFGDVFDNAGIDSARVIAPAPSPGQVGVLPAQFLIAAVQSAGLSWSPPANMGDVRVVRPGGARAMVAAPTTTTSTASPTSPAMTPASYAGPAAVRRNEVVTLTFESAGLRLTTRARATQDAAVGEHARLVNLQSNRTIDAIITAPGAATVETP